MCPCKSFVVSTVLLLVPMMASAATAPTSATPPEPASATSASASASTERVNTLQTVVVSGIRPGPALWKVTSGDKALWILGTVSPVPEKMEWYSPQSEAVLRNTTEIIWPPQAGVQVGFGSAFKAAFAMPTIFRARKNADGKLLKDVLPPDLYARWAQLKLRYIGKDKSIEEWRPIFAAGKLYSAALEKAGLTSGTGTGGRISEVAKERDIKRTPTSVNIAITDPKGLAKSFTKSNIDDVACFRSVLDRLELEVAHAALRANAWAVGNLPELTRLVDKDRLPTCLEAFAKVEAMKESGILDATEQSRAKWMKAVDAALATNATSFATLPMIEIVTPDGLLSKLRAKGYQIVEPQGSVQ